MNVFHAIELRRSVRAYTAAAVEKEKLEAIVKAGNLAPVFGRFHITVIQDPALLQAINQTTLERMKHSGNDFLEKRAATEGYIPLYGAPVLLVLSAPHGNDRSGFNMANVSCAAENMILAATELGLGTCFVMGPMLAFDNPDLAEKLSLPADMVPLVGVLVGYPAEPLAANARKTPENVTYLI